MYDRFVPYKDRAKQLEYQRRWMLQRRQDWIARNGPCVDCETWESLEVDHVDASMKVTHRVWSWTKAKREKELAKCVTRCTACHKKKSKHEHPKGENHWNAVLSDQQMQEIHDSTEPSRVLSARYGIGMRRIQVLRKGA